MDVSDVSKFETKESYEVWLLLKRHWEQGEAEGLAKGLAKGEAKGEAKGVAEGRLQGMREALLMVLAGRGLSPTEDEKARISALSSPEALHDCIRRAATANTVAEALVPAKKGRARRRPHRNGG